MKPTFDHEKLAAYQLSIELVAWVTDRLENIPQSLAVHDQLDRASTSIPLNIAGGNGKFTAPDRCRYFDNARGSALECAACLDVLVAKRKATEAEIAAGKEILRRIVSTLVGLIRSNSPDRLHEDAVPYRVAEGSAE
ncbi:MAG TPA: four helix bundle protein [Candidatus Acidoferrum sp.]|nr:four helix bundle protein [Candidatus Acidoferrum sp.]